MYCVLKALKYPAVVVQEADVGPPEGNMATEADQAGAAQQGAGDGAEAAWDLMKLLPSTLGDLLSGDAPGDPLLDAAPLDKQVRSELFPIA